MRAASVHGVFYKGYHSSSRVQLVQGKLGFGKTLLEARTVRERTVELDCVPASIKVAGQTLEEKITRDPVTSADDHFGDGQTRLSVLGEAGQHDRRQVAGPKRSPQSACWSASALGRRANTSRRRRSRQAASGHRQFFGQGLLAQSFWALAAAPSLATRNPAGRSTSFFSVCNDQYIYIEIDQPSRDCACKTRARSRISASLL